MHHQATDESATYNDHDKEVTEKRLENVLCPDDGGGKESSQAARRGKTTKKARKGKNLEREELQRWPTKKSKRDT